MTERPILFSAEMVRAILDGRKTQTRRVMKVQPWPDATVEVGPYHPHRIDRNGESQPGPATFGAIWDHQDIVNGGDAGLRCPYGAPGDLLWVRETWTQYPIELNPEPCDAWYKATSNGPPRPFKWRPSIHMPRWASRITLRITDIRVERLQDISCADAEAEGAGHEAGLTGGQAREAFSHLWNKINGPGAWEANPWVWVVCFERVKP
jgi:hypothetical protein